MLLLNIGTICTSSVVHESKASPLYLKFQDHKSLQKDADLEEQNGCNSLFRQRTDVVVVVVILANAYVKWH